MGNFIDKDRKLINDNPELKEKAKKLSECMFESSYFTVAGVALGTALSFRKKNSKYFFYLSGLGTLSDFFYSSKLHCNQLIEDFEKSKQVYREAAMEAESSSPEEKSAQN